MPSYAVLTCALHEHAYINGFISHYQNLGFNAIYIICDRFQPKYEPYLNMEKLNKIEIHFIHMNYPLNQYNAKFFEINQMNYYRSTIKQMNYDYIFLCDMDEYLYLPTGNIQSFMTPILQLPNVSQIRFPWMMVDSLDEDPVNMFDNLDKHKWYLNGHVKSMFKKNSLVYKNNVLQINTHTTMVKGRSYTQNGFQQPQTLDGKFPHSRFPIDFYKKNAFIIHFHTRSFKNNIIKLLTNKYSGKSDNNQKGKFLALVKNNNYDYKGLTKFSLIKAHQTIEVPHFELSGLNKDICNNNIDYNHKLFDDLLEYYNLSPKYFIPILENPEVVITPISTKYNIMNPIN
jgi:hypothetical protein